MPTSPITLQDIVTQARDYLSNYATGATDDDKYIRAANRAMEYIKKYLTLPSDEVQQSISYLSDTLLYDLSADFTEGLALIYDDANSNDPALEWHYVPYLEILRKTANQSPSKNLFSWMPINGKWQLVVYGTNINQGTLITTFDNIGSITGSNDALAVAIDTNIFKEGSGSLEFTVDPTKGNGLASITIPVNNDFTTLLQNKGFFKLYCYLASTAVSLNMRLYSSATDYFALSSATMFDDGTAFAIDDWGKVQFGFSGYTSVGSPNIKSITNIRIDVVEGAGFGASAVSGFRIDDLYTVMPDTMDLIYLSAYKGTDTTGITKKIFLTKTDDIPAFGLFVPDALDLVAMRTAINMVPQIMSNSDFRAMYKEEHKEIMAIYGKTWPRKRILNLGKLKLER